MEKTLRVDPHSAFQKILCFLNIYHSYHYWSGARKEDRRYAHFRRCTACKKLQIQTWYNAGSSLVENSWKKVGVDEINEPDI